MIVYSWKQYWNDFNNGDEWLFQDAGRPRDEEMFKLRPWLQSDKWKWRDANKDTWLPVHQYVWIAVAPTATWTYFKRVSDSWTEQQIKDCCSWYSSIISWGNVQGWTAESLVNDINSKKQAYWHSLAATKSMKVSTFGDDTIDSLSMANNWSYMIRANVMLSPATAFSSTWYKFFLYTMTSINNEEVAAHFSSKLTALNNSEIIDSEVMWNISQWENYYWAIQHTTGKNCLAVLTVTILQLW